MTFVLIEKGLVLEGWPSKIEVSCVLGISTLMNWGMTIPTIRKHSDKVYHCWSLTTPMTPQGADYWLQSTSSRCEVVEEKCIFLGRCDMWACEQWNKAPSCLGYKGQLYYTAMWGWFHKPHIDIYYIQYTFGLKRLRWHQQLDTLPLRQLNSKGHAWPRWLHDHGVRPDRRSSGGNEQETSMPWVGPGPCTGQSILRLHGSWWIRQPWNSSAIATPGKTLTIAWPKRVGSPGMQLLPWWGPWARWLDSLEVTPTPRWCTSRIPIKQQPG